MGMTADQLAQYFDHTQLRAYATVEDFVRLCEESKKYHFRMVAINPAPVALCTELLRGTDIHVGAAVGFPLGQSTRAIKRLEALDAIENGADEIDYVINITRLKEKDFRYVEQEMRDIVEVCRSRGAISKVIFENCYLTQAEKASMCDIALEVRPDFIKTSTGFGTSGALAADVAFMAERMQGRVKVKAAGGIRTLADALTMIELGASRIGSTASVAILEAFAAEQSGEGRDVSGKG